MNHKIKVSEIDISQIDYSSSIATSATMVAISGNGVATPIKISAEQFLNYFEIFDKKDFELT